MASWRVAAWLSLRRSRSVALIVGLIAALASWAAAIPVSGAGSAFPERSSTPAAVTVCGLSLCAAGKPFVIRGASAFGT
jgi:hypothetical protein